MHEEAFKLRSAPLPDNKKAPRVEGLFRNGAG